MTVSLWSLAAYALQLAALVTITFAAMWMLRIRIPRHSLRLWQAVLAIALLLPLAQSGNVEPVRAASPHRIVLGGRPRARARARSFQRVSIQGASSSLIVLAGIIARLLWLGLGLIKLRSILARAARR